MTDVAVPTWPPATTTELAAANPAIASATAGRARTLPCTKSRLRTAVLVSSFMAGSLAPFVVVVDPRWPAGPYSLPSIADTRQQWTSGGPGRPRLA
jgi:hypothetical protein